MTNACVRPTAGTTQRNGGGSIQLTKPIDWNIYMIDAALKVVSDETMPLRYQSDNEGKLLILKSLDYYEAHDDYVWPDFTALGFDFANTMRLRRALVHDIYVILEKSGRLQIGPQQVVTPPHSSDQGRKRTPEGFMTKAKQCGKKQKTEHSDDDDAAAANTNDAPFWHDSNFLAETMDLLIHRSRADVKAYLTEKDSDALADIVHDGLVNVWERPLVKWNTVPHGIASKSVAWAVYKRKADVTVEDSDEDSDEDSTASVIEKLKKRQGRETSIELGDHK